MNHHDWTAEQDETTLPVDEHDLRVAYYEAGVGNGGPPVVLLHGIPTWSFLWRHVVAGLAEDRHVIAPDLLGYGNSAMHDGFDRSIRAQEVMLAGLIEMQQAETVSLVGHDIGGGVALRYAVHTPDAVDQLVLSNAVAYDSWPIDSVVELGVPTVPESQPDLIDQLLGMAFSEEFMVASPEPAFVDGMKAPWASDRGRRSLVRNAISLNTNHTTELDPTAVTAETLLLWGADDHAQPMGYAERLADDIAEATVSGLENASHWLMEDRREEYVRRLQSFLV